MLKELYCFDNKISGDNMTALVNSLPDRNDKEEGVFWVIAKESDTEQNVITTAQAAVATARNWPVRDSYGKPYTPPGDTPSGAPKMVLTTAKSPGETIKLWIDATEADRPDVWIDLNNNGEKDDGEAVTIFFNTVEYTLGAQTVTVYGKVTKLGCENNQLTSLNVSNSTALKELWCNNNQLTTLDTSNSTALEYLDCSNNQLTSLNVSNSTALKELWCNNNQLTTLDTSNSTALEYLNCYNNQLTTLDVSNSTALEELYCFNNQLISLNVSNNTALKELRCHNNQLTTLDVSNSTALEELHCYDNQLTSLDVSNSTALKELYCYNNQLTTLDVSNNKKLEVLWCHNNQLTSLNVSNSIALKELWCFNNQLTSLDVSNNKELEKLRCYYNKISVANMTALVNSLPDRTGKEEGEFRVCSISYIEQNVITAAQAAIATGKKWQVLDSTGNPYTPGS